MAGMCAALRAAGVEVWFDASELRGGDAWDDQIRHRIKHCTFFVPIISANTEVRTEGYFRREWKLGIERSHDMADDRPFILPVALLDVRPEVARVPQRFRDLHWVKLPGGSHAELLVEELSQMHRKVAAKADAAGTSESGLIAEARADPSAPRSPSPPRGRYAMPLGIIVLSVVLAVAWKWWSVSHAPLPAAAPAAVPLDEKSVAVLPFVNMSGDAKDEYLSDGLSEELLAALGRDPALRIVARTSSFAFKGRAVSAQQIATQLGVARLIEGSVRRSGEQLRIVVQLVNGANGFRLWSHEYPVLLRDLFSVQASVADDVVAQLFPGAGRAPAPRRITTRNLDAYDAFLRARSFQAKPPVRENLEQAARFFQKATELDPAYAVAWARLGTVRLRLRTSGYDDSDTNLQRAHEAIQHALALDPDLPEAHAALADYFTKDWTNQGLAEKELEVARQGLPNDPDILLSLAACNLNLGRKSQAVQAIRQAATLDPQNGDTANFSALILDAASLYPEALAERDRAFQVSGWTGSLADKAFTYRNWKGDLSQALHALDASLTSQSDPGDKDYYWRIRTNFLRSLGDFKGALAAIDHINAELLPSQFYYHSKALLRAQVLESMGNPTAARAEYARALVADEHYRDANPKILRAYTSLALIYAGLGREPDARATVGSCLELLPPAENPAVASRTGLRIQAQVDARFGRMDAALETVRSQITAGFWKRQDLLLDPDWTLLRLDPRFL
ncbi:MAG: adenylate cyclase, partial [Acetobacteraceae bacterium]|nr:adenylate cyclase [Acetobacteraceae bacterium]